MDELHYQIGLLKAMNQKLESSEKMYRLVCDTSSNAFLYYSYEDEKLSTFGNWDSFFEFPVEHVRDLDKISQYIKEDHVIPLREAMFAEKEDKERAAAECQYLSCGKWFECETTVLYNEFHQPLEKIIRFKDITKFKRQNDELSYMAYYDSLTGLYNRNYFVRNLAVWLKKAEKDNSIVSVMFIDIDDFRKINDGLGLVVGDELVQVFGQYLKEFSTEKVIVSHFNSDIYCIGIYDPYGSSSVEHIYKTMHERLQKPFLLSNRQELSISVSVGVAEFPETSKDTLELINFAEIVMFKAKDRGKNAIQYFDAPILNDFLRNVAIETKLKEAVIAQQFYMNYQPQYEASTNRLRGVEALIRWCDVDGNLVSPSEFIPIAERNGSIVAIGNWVLRTTLSTFSDWKKKFDTNIIISINISAIQYKRMNFVSELLELIEYYGVDPRNVELEITETILIEDFDEVIEKMHTLREYGIRVSLDDFGTGFSSLAYLKGLPIDTLKIDKSFINTVIIDDSTRIITESIIKMVKRLGAETIAEGVETREQFEYLKEIQCDCLQGYFLGRPMSASEMEELLIREL